METQDVLRRLKQATTDRVPTPGVSDDLAYANGRVVLGEYCHNCGQDSLSAVVEARRLVPGEPASDGNQVSLCDDCNDDAHTAADATDDDSHTADDCQTSVDAGNHDATTTNTHDECARDTHAVDATAVRERDDDRCRGCGVRERIVVGDDLHLHPVVPIAGDGFRHPHNYVCLCPTCHRKVHA